MDPQLLKQLNVERAGRRAALLVTNLDDGGNHLIRPGGTVDDPLKDQVAKAFQSGKSVTIEADGQRYFLNVHLPSPRLVLIGAVHISQALAPMAKLAGFDVRVIDPRSAFATGERFEGVDLTADWPDEALKHTPLDAYTAVAAVTHDPKIDDYALISALETGCFYVGALGSRKTHARRLDRLQAAGVNSDRLERISAPIGLNIGAASPAEIAVAILAELISTLRLGQADKP